MKTLILNGSPRKNGDTASLLAVFKREMDGEYLQVDAYGNDISPCVDCRYCWTHSGCAISDKMQDIYAYIQQSDRILIASPVYFSELPGKVLDVGSRLQTFYCAKHFRNEQPIGKSKKGGVILVGGGDGTPKRAYATAKILLRQMNCSQIHPPVVSLNTNTHPAAEDLQAVAGVKSIAAFFRAPL